MKRKLVITLGVVLVSILASSVSIAFAESSDGTMWGQAYGGTENDYANSLVQTGDGGYAIVGSTSSSASVTTDTWLVKVDSSGNMEWDQTYGGTDRDVTHSMVKTTDEGYALAGATESFGAGITDFWAAKTDEQGAIPELSTWVLMVLLLTITLVAIVIKRRHSAKVNKT